MSSLVALKIDEQALHGTPSHEWADKTLRSAEQTPYGQVPASSTAASTPGPEFPGAYPRGVEELASHAREGSAGVLEMARQYLTVQADVEKALRSATETAKQYLPQSVASYFPGTQPTTSLPSQEHDGNATTSSVGVGSLPGSISESSVAKLPEERLQEEKGNATGGVGDLPGTKSETEVAKLPDERIQELTASTNEDPSETVSGVSIMAQAGTDSDRSLSSSEFPPLTPTGQSARLQSPGEAGGVDDDPASKVETTGALPPDERKEVESPTQSPLSAQPLVKEPQPNLQPRTHPLAAEDAHWKGVPLDEGYQAYLDKNPDKQFNLNTTTSPAARSTVTDASGHSQLNSMVVDAGHERPSEIPPKSSIYPGSREKVGNQSSLVSADSKWSHGSDCIRSSGSPRKTKLMDKIKGEVKVISGKLGGKEDKVEEGRRLMGKV